MLLFALGAATGLAGIFLDRTWLVAAGTVFLAVALAIAIVGHKRRMRDSEDQNDVDT
jgi:hypothetical protein